MNETENCVGESVERLAAAYQRLVELCEKVNLMVNLMEENVRQWVKMIAEKLEAQHEEETALRWASVCNRPLYDRHRHAKKLRIRKKYEKRILAWYRAEIID